MKEFLILFKCLASNNTDTIFKWLDLLFKELHKERTRRKNRILARLLLVPLVVVILSLFINIWFMDFLQKNLIIMSISTKIYRPYVCDTLGLYIFLVNKFINPITPYWSKFID